MSAQTPINQSALEELDMLASDPERRRLVAFLKEGGVLLHEDLGGVVGDRWCPAHRCGKPFDPKACESLLSTGCKVGGKAHALLRVDGVSSETYMLAEVAQ